MKNLSKSITATVAIAISAAALSGCTATQVETKTYNTASDVAAAYAAAGGNCANPTDYKTLPGNSALLCADGVIITKLTPENAKEMHDKIASVNFPQGQSLIAGSDWSMFGAFGGKAEQIAGAVGGQVLSG